MPSHETTLELSEYRTSMWLGYRRAYRCRATNAGRSSSQATGTRGKVSQPGHRRMNGWSATCGNEKNSRPWTPPNPYDEDASTKIGRAILVVCLG